MENNATPPPLLLPEPGVGRKLYKQLIVTGAALLLTFIGAVLIIVKTRPVKAPPPAPIITPSTEISMIIASDAFENNNFIPGKYTCDGLNISPPLRFANIPPDAVSLALIVDDPDAVSGDWTHWLVWNIAPKINGIAENSPPKGATAGLTDFGANKWGGPCPPATPKLGEGGPQGAHHYEFKLYALNTILDIPASSTKTELLNAMRGHIIAEAKLTGLYSR